MDFKQWGLVLAVVGPMVLLANLIMSLISMLHKKRKSKGTSTLLITGIIIAVLFILIASLVFEHLGTTVFLILLFVIPQIVAFFSYKNVYRYLLVLFLSLGIGLFIFILLGFLFGQGHIS